MDLRRIPSIPVFELKRSSKGSTLQMAMISDIKMLLLTFLYVEEKQAPADT